MACVFQELRLKDEVELTVAEKWMPAGGTRPTGLRIKKLSPGTVVFETLLQEHLLGEVSKEAPPDKDDVHGTILVCDDAAGATEVPYLSEEGDENILVVQEKRPEIGDTV